MTISNDAFIQDRVHLGQVRNWYRQALRLYMGASRSTLDPFPVWYQIDSLTTIQFRTVPNGAELYETHVNTA